jgi:hypothetical protein
MLFPKLHRVDAMKRTNTIIIVLGVSFVASIFAVALMLTKNSQIGK